MIQSLLKHCQHHRNHTVHLPLLLKKQKHYPATPIPLLLSMALLLPLPLLLPILFHHPTSPLDPCPLPLPLPLPMALPLPLLLPLPILFHHPTSPLDLAPTNPQAPGSDPDLDPASPLPLAMLLPLLLPLPLPVPLILTLTLILSSPLPLKLPLHHLRTTTKKIQNNSKISYPNICSISRSNGMWFVPFLHIAEN